MLPELEHIEAVKRLSRDLARAARDMSRAEARYLVDIYYQVQEHRIATTAQTRTLAEGSEPSELSTWVSEQFWVVESGIKRALDHWTDAHPVGQWSRLIVGIGPVLAAGLLAHIDIERAPTVGHIWRFAGLDPTVTWEKGQKRPWNARLKVLCWKIGESFTKFQNHEDDIYGKIYAARKRLEIERNESGAHVETAKQALTAKSWKRDTVTRVAYECGVLPDGRIHLRAQRYAVKLFLSHWHHVAYETHYGKPPPKPFIIEHGGHAHMIAPPNW